MGLAMLVQFQENEFVSGVARPFPRWAVMKQVRFQGCSHPLRLVLAMSVQFQKTESVSGVARSFLPASSFSASALSGLFAPTAVQARRAPQGLQEYLAHKKQPLPRTLQ